MVLSTAAFIQHLPSKRTARDTTDTKARNGVSSPWFTNVWSWVYGSAGCGVGFVGRDQDRDSRVVDDEIPHEDADPFRQPRAASFDDDR